MGETLPEFLRLDEALRAFARAVGTQSQEHIRPLHKHFAIRLVVEGGFLPNEVVPHPPLRSVKRAGQHVLEADVSLETSAEQSVIGGLKSKKIDVVVSKANVGPVIAISLKGTGNAFRNLTNRMEEAVGDCTNIHLRYPSLVYGFFHVLKAVRQTVGIEPTDVSLELDGTAKPIVLRYASALEQLTGRKLWRDEPSAYECTTLVMVESDQATLGTVIETQFGIGLLSPQKFMQRLLETYDTRYPYMADASMAMNRVEWSRESPFFSEVSAKSGLALDDALGYMARLG